MGNNEWIFEKGTTLRTIIHRDGRPAADAATADVALLCYAVGALLLFGRSPNAWRRHGAQIA